MASYIFDYYDKKENEYFSKMSGKEIRELLYLLNNYKIEYRNTINAHKDTSIGVELEYEKADNFALFQLAEKDLQLKKWIFKNEISVVEGGELVSPVLHDKEECWYELERACRLLSDNAVIDENAGAHVHIGSLIFDTHDITLLNFLKIWTAYENVILRFLYGEYLTWRPSMLSYAPPTSEYFLSLIRTFERNKSSYFQMITYLRKVRRQNVNFRNVCIADFYDENIKDTVEFRGANGTLNHIIWQNMINFYIKLLYYSNAEVDEDIIKHRMKKTCYTYSDLSWSNRIFLDQSLELVDLIFDNNEDKINFLRQYLKDLREIKQSIGYIKSAEFTRK